MARSLSESPAGVGGARSLGPQCPPARDHRRQLSGQRAAPIGRAAMKRRHLTPPSRAPPRTGASRIRTTNTQRWKADRREEWSPIPRKRVAPLGRNLTHAVKATLAGLPAVRSRDREG